MVRPLLSAALLAATVAASPKHTVSDYIEAAIDKATNITASDVEPCLLIRNAQASNARYYNPDVALQCLRSVPLHADDGQVQLQGVKELVQFQSTLAYLKDPPPGYTMPAVDIVGGLDTISDQLKAGYYKNEYDFQVDISQLISAAYDGHFHYYPDIVKIFSFVRLDARTTSERFQVVSLSQDGSSLPEVYDLHDLAYLAYSNLSAGYTPSPIQQINGQDVEVSLNEFAAIVGQQLDPDANYNTLFPSFPGLVGYGYDLPVGAFASSDYYFGNTTTVRFANGSTARFPNAATSKQDFSNVTDGSSFFQVFCTNDIQQEIQASNAPPPPAPSNSTSNTTLYPTTEVPYAPIATGQATLVPLGYPTPLAIAGDSSVAGYLPDSRSDLAVISLPNYGPGPKYVYDFENVIRETLATAKSLGKSKLIIDLRANPGGTAVLATDVFKQLFPSAQPTSNHNIRAQALYNWAGKLTTEQFVNTTDATATMDDQQQGYAGQLMINAATIEGADGSSFGSWADWYHPQQIHNDEFTPLFVTNFSEWWDTAPTPVYGYINDTAPQPQTFDAENIILLQDGYCASTCTIFSELMKNIAGVKSVVVGGRKQLGPMQGVGGVRGSSAQEMVYLWQGIQQKFINASPADQSDFNATFDNGVPGSFWTATGHALSRAQPDPQNVVNAGVNYQNNIRPGDETNTPLQFVYEASDCRFFYTPIMYEDQSAVWSYTYDLIWGNATCVSGSTGQSSAGNVTGSGELAPASSAAYGTNDTIFPSGDLGSAVVATQTASATLSISASTSVSNPPATTATVGSSTSAPSASASVQPQTTNGASSNAASVMVGVAAALAAGMVVIA